MILVSLLFFLLFVTFAVVNAVNDEALPTALWSFSAGVWMCIFINSLLKAGVV